jgi:drug/metabolite transporter (DMT)-like permease
VARVESVEQVNKRIWRVIASIDLALGVAGIILGAVSGKWWTLVTGVIWLLAGACWWVGQSVLRRRERSTASRS